MKKWILAFVLSSQVAFALDAVVTVLETPLFGAPDYDAPVVQYLRKGDVIKIHPSIGNDRSMDQYAPSEEKLAESNRAQETFHIEDEFIPTLDRRGHRAYVLSEHIFVYFNDSRELSQTVPKRDPTDYRLQEPLSKNYPLKSATGYRGQFLAGFTQPYYESYPYQDQIKRKGYTSPMDLNLTFLKLAPGNYQERLFIGGSLNFRYFENTYTFQDKRFSKEEGMKFGVGPTISYDAFKGEKNRLNLSGTILFHFIDRLNISQSLYQTRSDSRLYTAYSFAPRISLQYHRKGILEEIDFVLGTTLEMGSATSFQAKNGGKEPTWWRELGSDKFNTRTTYTLGGYVGIQSAY